MGLFTSLYTVFLLPYSHPIVYRGDQIARPLSGVLFSLRGDQILEYVRSLLLVEEIDALDLCGIFATHGTDQIAISLYVRSFPSVEAINVLGLYRILVSHGGDQIAKFLCEILATHQGDRCVRSLCEILCTHSGDQYVGSLYEILAPPPMEAIKMQVPKHDPP